MPRDNQNLKGWTELKLAAWKNLEECVEVLLERGADPDVADHEQYTALHNAINHQPGHSAFTLLEYGADPNVSNKDGSLHRIRTRVPYKEGTCVPTWSSRLYSSSPLPSSFLPPSSWSPPLPSPPLPSLLLSPLHLLGLLPSPPLPSPPLPPSVPLSLPPSMRLISSRLKTIFTMRIW